MTPEHAGDADEGEGIGCRVLVTAVAILLGFAIVSVALGLTLIGMQDPTPLQEFLGLTAYGAGAPISGLFAALAGDLPLTIYLDVLVWVLAAAGIARLSDRGRPITRLCLVTIGIALAYGVVIASSIELV
jgi:hypothetical protein